MGHLRANRPLDVVARTWGASRRKLGKQTQALVGVRNEG